MAVSRAKKQRREARRRSRFRSRKELGGRLDVREAGGGILGAALRPFIRPIARAVARSPVGRRAATIARQQITRVPIFRRFATTTRRARDSGLGQRAGMVASATPAPGKSIARRAVRPVGTAVVAGAALEGGSRVFNQVFPGGTEDVARGLRGIRRRPPRSGGSAIAFQPGQTIAPNQVVKTWMANGVPFAQLADGRVMVQKKNGTIKTFRRPKPIVLGRNPGVRDIVRADKKIEALMKVMRKRMPAARRRTAARHDPTPHRVTVS